MNILYSVYVKYKVWFIINKPSEKHNYKLFINENGAEIHTDWEIKNNTLQTYGKKILLIKLKILLK